MSPTADRRRTQAADRLVRQARELVTWFAARSPDELARPTRLDGWDVRTLGAHLLMMLQGVAPVLDQPTRQRPVSLHGYVARYRVDVDDIARRTLDVQAELADSGADLATELDTVVTAVAARLSQPWPDVVTGLRGPLRADDFVASRIIELVAHSDDLEDAGLDAVPIDPQALGAATRALAAMLEDRYPGRTIEVRMPPYAAVQCGTADHEPSPAHTRGTPPNVIELAPLLFVRLATGRLSWADAVASGAVRASGIRADLTDHLPLLS